MKLSATGHGEDPCRYFEGFLATIQGFPLIVTAIAGYYNTHPLVANKTIATLFAYLTPRSSPTPDRSNGNGTIFRWSLYPSTQRQQGQKEQWQSRQTAAEA